MPTSSTLYASEGFNGATMLFADVERLRFRATAFRTLTEGEVFSYGDARPDCVVTWATADDIDAELATRALQMAAE